MRGEVVLVGDYRREVQAHGQSADARAHVEGDRVRSVLGRHWSTVGAAGWMVVVREGLLWESVLVLHLLS